MTLIVDGVVQTNPYTTIHAVGEHNYTCVSNETYEYFNSTVYATLRIVRVNICTINITPESFATYPEPVNASCSCTYNTDNITLLRDGENVTFT
jgi:hypothetical protein